jgi:lambda family phage portal protein
MRRNDGYVQTGQTLHRDHIVGSMYLLNASPNIEVLGLDEKWAEEFQAEVEAKFMLAAESEDNWFDASRRNTLTGLVRLATGVYATGGEVLATAEWSRETIRPFKTMVQFVDCDRLSTPWDKQGVQDERVRGGIKQNRYGAPVGYYIRDAHPSDVGFTTETMTWTYVPVRKPWGRMQVCHIQEQMRIDQSRGVADIVAGLKETRIAKKFRDITLQQAVVAAMYAASIESDLPSEAVFNSMGAGNLSAGAAAAAYAGDYLSAIAKYAGSSKHMQIDGVRIPHFFPGTRLQVRQVGAPGGVGQEFEQSLLRYLAAILGVSYEELSRDFSKTNYSSARAAMVGTWRFMQSRKKAVADRMANFIYLLWLEEQLNAGEITAMPRNAPNFYEPLMKEAYGQATWIGAARGQIDELKETQAAVLRIKYGLSTHEDELARMGKDWRKVYVQLERERKERELRGIELQESNSVNAASGAPREKNGSEDTGENSTNAE